MVDATTGAYKRHWGAYGKPPVDGPGVTLNPNGPPPDWFETPHCIDLSKDGLLYVGDLGGTVYCLDAATGAHLWKHETNDAIWGCLVLAGDRLYVGNAEGLMTVLRAGRRKELLAQIEMDAPLYSRPAVIGDALYLATASRLYLIAAKP